MESDQEKHSKKGKIVMQISVIAFPIDKNF